MTGCEVTADCGGATGAEVTIFGCGDAVAGDDSKDFGGSFSRFNRKISDSSSPSRWESSSMRFFELTARTINQIASATGIPRITKTTRAMPDSIFNFNWRYDLAPRSLSLFASLWQAAKVAQILVIVSRPTVC
jgi:hypothetical protein